MDPLTWIQAHLLSIILLAPLAGGIAVMIIPGRSLLAIRLVSAVAASISLLGSIYLFLDYSPGTSPLVYEEFIEWIPGSGITYHLAVDGVSISLVLLTGLVIFTGVFASWTITHRTKEFYALLLVLVTGVFGVFLSWNLFFFFLFYELAVLPMYLLIGIWGTGRKEYSAMKLTLYLLVGSGFMLVGILAIYFYSGLAGAERTFDLVELTERGSFWPDFQRVVFFLLYIGFGVLAGIFPLHTWSPDGHSSAPTAVSMLHAGVLMKLGAYGVLRVGVGLLPDGAHQWAYLVGAIAVINILYGAVVAMGQRDLKYVIAYSSVSHMGVVMLGIATLNAQGLTGSVFQMFSHGIMTGLFFALVGLVYEKAHTRDFSKLGGLARRMPGIVVAFTIGGLASFGVPGTSGFIAEFWAFYGTWLWFVPLAVLAIVGIVITALYVLRMLQMVFFGDMDPRYDEEKTPDARTTEWVAPVVLSATLVLFGVVPGSMVRLINQGLVDFLAKVSGS